ncbi:type VII secretion target [uncultured Microbacterium sp.]|uniref:type VII secretion target n=1 Tax=uncultured Microbacterium sp. TaxID=191216 RepID=UPI0028D8B40F|nr:type VII secretion target [uncultured Microbacterium sp.]
MTDVDTDDLRAWAAKADAVRADFGSCVVARSSGLGAPWVDDAVDRFATVWSTAVERRLADVDMFAENLRQTADVFDQGDDASRSELDQMIWSESDY